ncbi:MAG: hypothetical protein AUH81_20260 [Candidatus Rokubacteria bacterium 13_1_40CM_4_69_5]|nr:MAG: hypothetical protein AUH81_20260 [Candidatus Rokubacteria bacterium 13_1_40CM_4_69_5]
MPFPTAATALAPNLPGLSAGPVEVQVFLQTGAGNFSLLLSVTLTVTDTRSAPGVSAITPSSIHLAMHGPHGCRVCDGSPRDASA